MSVIFCYGKKMRASRLLAILILLQLRERLTAEALAAEFEVSIRTIYRDIDSLSAAGVPVYGDAGPGGGFRLLDGYRSQLTGLDADEVEAMLLIGHGGAATALGLGNAAGGARRKLVVALPSERRQMAERLGERVYFDMVDWYRSADPVPHLPAILRTVLDQRRIAMRYTSWRGTHDWDIEPLGLVMKSGHWYLVARGRAKIRIFRLANVSALRTQTEHFVRPDDFDLPAWWADAQARFEAELFGETAILNVSALGRQRLAALSPRGAAAVAGLTSKGWARAEMAVENSDHGARELLSLGAEVEVIAPASLRARIHALAAAIAARHYGDSDGDGG